MVLLLFILIPVFEIAGFIIIGDFLGILPTMALTILTAFIGLFVLKTQGLSTFASAKEHMNSQKMPFQEIFDGIALFTAGIFLLIPGFITDSIGLILLIPQVRVLIYNMIADSQKNAMNTGFSSQAMFNDHERPEHKTGDKTIEVEYTKIND